jgi:hypothetical protein
MKAPALFIFVLLTATVYSQNSINNYKYVIVPDKFDFSRTENQYGLNNLAKLLLDEKGFTAFVGDAGLPPEVVANKCNALKAEVTEKKGLFVTNLTLVLKDCQGNIIFKSKEGKSREKEYHLAYDQALRDAFVSLKNVPYKYDGTTFTQAQPATATPAPSTTPSAPATAPATPAVNETTSTLYAQATSNGYQLIDTTPKKVLTLLKTSMQDYFIAEDDTSKGVVFRKNGEWFFEYYKDNQLISRKLQIKF